MPIGIYAMMESVACLPIGIYAMIESVACLPIQAGSIHMYIST